MGEELSEGLYQKLVEQALAGVYVIQDGYFAYTNKYFAQLFGFDSPEQVINKVPVKSLVHPDDLSMVINNIRIREEGIVHQIRYQFRGLTRQKETIYVEVHGDSADYHGRPAVVGVIIDRTEEELAKLAAQQQVVKTTALLNADLIGIITWDKEGYIQYANNAFKDMIGITDEDLKQRIHWHRITPGEYFYACIEHINGIIKTGKGSVLQKELYHRDGHRIPVIVNGAKLDGENEAGVSFILDISSSKTAEERLEKQSAQLDFLAKSNLVGIYHTKANGPITGCNDKVLEFLGYTREEFENNQFCFWDFLAEESYDRLQAAILELEETGITPPTEKYYKHKDGSLKLALSGAVLTDMGTKERTVFFIDITEIDKLKNIALNQKDVIKKLGFEASHDQLTRLQNRNMLQIRINQLIAKARREETSFTIGFIDLDDFKSINDSLGHTTGDDVLQKIANCLSDTLREADLLARFGGDEFVVLIDTRCDQDHCDLIEGRINDAMSQLNVNLGVQVKVSCSIGWATFPEDGNDLQALMNVADQRMFSRKNMKK